ncbi:hypothetical protein QE152_g4608 [Popillia japonica]|uniref:Uncharacterized protein n=1 Tax=Popillia japonica TaxID=7064 RepID=A0AAW1N0D3_POPJA
MQFLPWQKYTFFRAYSFKDFLFTGSAFPQTLLSSDVEALEEDTARQEYKYFKSCCINTTTSKCEWLRINKTNGTGCTIENNFILIQRSKVLNKINEEDTTSKMCKTRNILTTSKQSLNLYKVSSKTRSSTNCRQITSYLFSQ